MCLVKRRVDRKGKFVIFNGGVWRYEELVGRVGKKRLEEKMGRERVEIMNEKMNVLM